MSEAPKGPDPDVLASLRREDPPGDIRVITIRVPAAVWAQLDRLAFEHRTSKTALVRAALTHTYGDPP